MDLKKYYLINLIMDFDNKEQKMREYIIKFDMFKTRLKEKQNSLTHKEKLKLYKSSLKTGDPIGEYIFNTYIDLDYGLIELG